jgi:hypothetical protein
MVRARRRLARYLFYSTDPQRTRVTWWDVSELGLVAFSFLAYFLVRGAVVDRASDALDHARWIIDLQIALGVFIEPDVQAWVLDYDVASRFLNFVYFWLDFPLIAVVGLVLFWKRRNSYTLIRDAMLISGGMALVLYWVYPVAPPRFLPEWGFVDTLETFDNLSYQAQTLQPFVNPFAAVPSLHVGWSMLLAIGAFVATGNLAWRLAAIAVFVLQSISVVGTGNHYIFDGVVGLVVCGIALGAAVWMQRVGYPSIRLLLGRMAGVPPAEAARAA